MDAIDITPPHPTETDGNDWQTEKRAKTHTHTPWLSVFYFVFFFRVRGAFEKPSKHLLADTRLLLARNTTTRVRGVPHNWKVAYQPYM